MSQRDIFNLKTWNFLQGDRQVENILRDLSAQSTLVVRNQLLNVLPTLAGIHDLSATGWHEDGFEGQICAPIQALLHNLGPLQTLEQPRDFYTRLLQAYGIQVRAQPRRDQTQLLMLLNPCEREVSAGDPALFRALESLMREMPYFVVVLPPGERLHPDLQRWGQRSLSALHYTGLNVFNHSGLEELLSELPAELEQSFQQGGRLTLAGYPAETVFYSAIGAVDYFIASDANSRNPAELSLSDLLAMGQRVTVLEGATAWPDKAVPNYLATHLQKILGVSPLALPQRPPIRASAESIAIDIL